MIISGGKVIAIDKVNHDDTLTGDGRFEPLGINQNSLDRQIYFSGTLGRDSSNSYFSIKNNTLSANPNVKFFNLCVNYTVSTTGTCPDFIYNSNVSFNNINNIKYIDGYIPQESYSYSYDVLNDVTNTYNFNLEKDNKLNISDVKVSCIGFVTSGYNPEPTEVVNALARENNDIIIFNSNDIALRV